ncbi:MAG TPA: helix-turn-helix domain-containing protein, partial [Candidatus Sulfotelmatobacter sp.]|nr:helix-turn-helix domain-containing protein [Candidatus Sulfotelmatobacter sp.]
LMYVTCQPCAALASHVEKLWCCDGHPGVNGKDRALPDGRFQLAFSLVEGPISALADPMGDGGEIAPSLLIGIRSRFSIIDTAKLRSAMGVVFRPGGVHAFLNMPADAFHDKNVSLDLIWGSMVRTLRDRLRTANHPDEKFRVLEVALLEHLNERVQLNAAVRYALQEFARKPQIPRVRELAQEAGLSRRRFAQVFREQIGLTPKLYCRLQRFQNALKQIASGASVDWAQIALAAGYCDQAHLAHEFRDFSGLSPSAYLAAAAPSNHTSID